LAGVDVVRVRLEQLFRSAIEMDTSENVQEERAGMVVTATMKEMG
jgi:hypothetical protein